MGKITLDVPLTGDAGTTTVSALLDSGAALSLIRRNVADRVTRSFVHIDPPIHFKMANGIPGLATDTGCMLTLRLKDKVLPGSFCVVETLAREAIIGVDFMQTWEIMLDPKNHDFTIGLDPESVEIAGLSVQDRPSVPLEVR